MEVDETGIFADNSYLLHFSRHGLGAITIFGYSFRFDEQPNRYSFGQSNFYFTGELGHMINQNQRSALGVTFFIGFDDDGSRLGLKPRYRRWLNRTTSLDVSSGILCAGSNNQFTARFPGFTGHVGLSFGDWVALIGQMEILHLRTVGTDAAWYAGVKLGSHAGPISAVALLGVLAVAVATSFD